MQNLMKYSGLSLVIMSAMSLAACGGGSGSSSATGSLSLAVTDAPVDLATEVVVRFTRVELQPSEGERISIEFDEVQEVDLLSYQGEDAYWLFEDTEVPAGEYEWIRLYVERDGVADNPPASNFGTTSYVRFENGDEYRLAIPSGLQTGLKLVGGFSVDSEGVTRLVIDVNLQRALVQPKSANWSDYYFLRPALRLARMDEVGHLHGTIDTAVFTVDPDCETNGAVYLYSGHDQALVDVQDAAGPLASARVEYDGDAGQYQYRIGHLPAGGYTVALTCEAHLDDPEAADDIGFFEPATNVVIQAGAATEQDLP